MKFDFRDGDPGWTGIDMTRERDALEPGMLALGQNTRLRTRRARQRSGTAMPGDFNPTNGFTNYLVGSGVFTDPNGDELLLVAPAEAQYAYALRFGKDPFVVTYSAAEIASGRTNGVGIVEFVQSFQNVNLLRRPFQGGKQLVWDGTGDSDRNGVANTFWTEIALSTNGRTLVPPRFNAESFQDRLVYYNANFPAVATRDEIIVSDINDYTSYDPTWATNRINTAESDFITRVFGYFRRSIVVFKSQSIHQAILQPTFPLSFVNRALSETLGSYGNKIPIEIGGDVH